MVAGESTPDDPEKRKQRQREAEPKLGALERRRPLEIIEVDALRELFGCACACHRKSSQPFAVSRSPSEKRTTINTCSVTQSHHGVDGAEQD